MFRVIRRKHAQAATNKRKPLNVITPEQIQAAEAWVHAFYEGSNSNTYIMLNVGSLNFINLMQS